MSGPLPSWARLSQDERHVTLTLHVQPNARSSSIFGRHGDALKVRVAAPAIDDRANQALREVLSRSLDVPRAAVRILQGHAARRKIIEVALDRPDILNRIRSLDNDPT